MQINRINTYSANNNNNNIGKNNRAVSFHRNWGEHISWGANYIKSSGKTNFKLFTFPDAKAVFVEIANKAQKEIGGIKERIVQVLGFAGLDLVIENILPKDDKTKIHPMMNKGNGIFEARDIEAQPDDMYRYIIVTKNNEVKLVKDPYSKKQEDIHGWSSIYNSDNYVWKNTDWLEGNDRRRIIRRPEAKYRGLEKLVIEEVNIPTLTKDGSFESAKEKIDEIAANGIATAIEIMPVENTFSKQWGYDGVDKFAVNEKLGGAAKLKELIDYAHGKGLNIIMDMVPNHMGPDGDYLAETGPYEDGVGAFGALLNYEKADNRYVRDWMVNAALWWANEFKVDGLRFDMTKMTASDYLLKQIVDELNEHNPDVFLIAEDGENNRIAVTAYDNKQSSHDDKLEMIDQSVHNIQSKGWNTYPSTIGFDSEWDFPLMHSIKDLILDSNQAGVNKFDELITKSEHRIKYAMSHDEIGNMDGTRLITKVVAQYLNIFEKVSGQSDPEKGQKAAHVAQKLVQYIATQNSATESDFSKYQKSLGMLQTVTKDDVEKALLAALAKQRLMFGTIMTIPGPKMFFQGDEKADLSYFKFFREFSDDEEKRQNPVYVSKIINDKGYDTITDEALPDSIVGEIIPTGKFASMQDEMLKFNMDLKRILNENKGLQNGVISKTYKDHGNLVHIHRVKCGEDRFLIIKNYADRFYNGDYSTLGFPKESKYIEIFNSDDKMYGGTGLTNKDREISDLNQHMNMAANSIIILKRMGKA